MPQKKNGNQKNNSNQKKKPKKIKKSTIKKISAVIVLIAVLAVVLYFAFKTLTPEKSAAIVNGEIITNQELEQKYSQLPDQYKLFITKEDFLDQIIAVKLLLQEAEKKAIVISEEEIETELDLLRSQSPTEEAFNQLLSERNIKLSELKKQISEQLIINKLLNETVFSKIEITESKIKGYYEQNKDNLKTEEGEIIAFDEVRDQIEQVLFNDISNNAVEIYISQLELDAEIIKDGDEVEVRIESFKQTTDEVCKEDGKAIIRLFSTTKNPASQWVSETFDSVVNEYAGKIVAYHWQLDSGDNTLTDVKEGGLPKEEVGVFKKYNSKSTVPTYVFGCRYVRVGNAYDTLEAEKAEFKRIIERLIV